MNAASGLPRSAPEPIKMVVDGASKFYNTRSGQVHAVDNVSLQVKRIVTGPLYQPLALGAESAAPVIIGAVKSTLMPPIEVSAVLPALSAALPEAV